MPLFCNRRYTVNRRSAPATRMNLQIHGAFRAALVSISETLRLELSPFNVDVVTIMTGRVGTNFHDNDIKLELPSGSRYAPIEEIIAGWASGKSVPKGCSSDEFAESLVDDSVIVDGSKLKGNGKLIWRGPYSGVLWALAGFLPRWCLDVVMTANQGLKELARHFRDESKRKTE